MTKEYIFTSENGVAMLDGKEVGIFKYLVRDLWTLGEVSQYYPLDEWRRIDRPRPQASLF